MVKAIIDISDEANRVLGILKAKYGLKDKSQAIDLMAQKYQDELMEPELRPEYIQKLKKVKSEKGIKFKNIHELRRIIEN